MANWVHWEAEAEESGVLGYSGLRKTQEEKEEENWEREGKWRGERGWGRRESREKGGRKEGKKERERGEYATKEKDFHIIQISKPTELT